MTIRVALRHRTSYRYDRPIRLGPQVVRLRPAPHTRTEVVSYSLRVAPGGHFLNWQQDPQGNFLARLVFPEPTTRFDVDVELLVDMKTINPFDFFLEPGAEEVPFSYDAASLTELAPYLKVGEGGPLVEGLVRSRLVTKGTRTNDFLVALNQEIQRRVKYVIRMEPGVQTPEQTL